MLVRCSWGSDGYKGFTLVTANLFSDGVPQARVASNRPQPVLDGAGDGSYSNNCVRVWDTDAGRVHGFSNSHCDDPSWPKVSFLRDRVTEILAALPVRKGMHHPDCGRFCCSPANMCGLLPAPLSDAQVLALAEKLAVPMGRTEPFPDDAVPDVGFSPLLPAQERCVGCLGVEPATPPQLMSVLRGAWLGMCRELQKRAFIPASVTHRSYGTRAQTIVIADTGWCAGQCVHHCPSAPHSAHSRCDVCRGAAAVHMLYRNVEGYPDVGEWLHFRVPRPTQSQLANRQRCVAGTGHRGYRVYHSAATASPGTTPGVFGLSWQHMLTATAIVAIAAVAVTVVLKRTGRGG